ncbi:CinA family protein [Corynebacterium sp. zg-331]|uniref:CinA family protein n=1 Tax=unclassified Corynebacterium TaxID=2624378 RepID=UPI00128B7365|nr:MULTISPECIES: CinA family protein [unclassified Corynebacterium]MBC3185375.1 CinA family protein [Corynebacterium sp. zg-331]MPV51872.1 nicotinamide-nucleotide amidohydrolase family protein [Corynebacterium sp. zg331]
MTGAAKPSVSALATEVVELLARRGETLGWCESLTAGLASATVAEVPGASAVLRGAMVVYAVDLKESLAGVPGEVLAHHGPVAGPTVLSMARGCARRLRVTWAVALTGVAGPEPHDGHPVGEVWLGYYGPGVRRVQRIDLTGGRAEIRQEAVWAALDGLLREVRSDSIPQCDGEPEA